MTLFSLRFTRSSLFTNLTCAHHNHAQRTFPLLRPGIHLTCELFTFLVASSLPHFLLPPAYCILTTAFRLLLTVYPMLSASSELIHNRQYSPMKRDFRCAPTIVNRQSFHAHSTFTTRSMNIHNELHAFINVSQPLFCKAANLFFEAMLIDSFNLCQINH